MLRRGQLRILRPAAGRASFGICFLWVPVGRPHRHTLRLEIHCPAPYRGQLSDTPNCTAVAKTSAIEKNNRRKARSNATYERRQEMTKRLKNPETPDDERREIYLRLRKMGRDASPVRWRHRCALTGRSRGNYQKFNMSRNKFRELALLGHIPGVRKASW